jgi:hypothetical protein
MFLAHPITLSKDIAAIAIEGSEQGKPRYGLISHLPKGTELTLIGDGFNQGTATVRCNDQSYFVFLQDIELLEPSYVAF